MTINVYVIQSTFGTLVAQGFCSFGVYGTGFEHRTLQFVKEVADADGFGTPWRAWGLMTDGLCAP